MYCRLASGMSDLLTLGESFPVEDGFFRHPLLARRALESREYQRRIAEAALETNTLVVLPTGLGKTGIAILMAAAALWKGKRALVLAPTRPLVEQHAATFAEALIGARVGRITGEDAPAARQEMYARATVLVATPECVAHDLDSGRLAAGYIGFVVYDEAHRALGEYAYVAVARALRKTRPLSLGLSASPGSSLREIRAVMRNLALERIETRVEADEDVAGHVHRLELERVVLGLPGPILEAARLLQEVRLEKIARLQAGNFLRFKPAGHVGIEDLVACGRTLLRFARRNPRLWGLVSLQRSALRAFNAERLLTTQGPQQAAESLASRSKRARHDARLEEALRLAESERHPKVPALVDAVRGQLAAAPASRVLVFTQFRSTAGLLQQELRAAGIPCGVLHGQGSRRGQGGMRQTDQSEAIRGLGTRYPVLVSTSVGEEGLHLPHVDVVVFYEPVPSAIRAVQRRGRTARSAPGRVVVLVAAGTVDEAALASADRREAEMKETLSSLAAANGSRTSWGQPPKRRSP